MDFGGEVVSASCAGCHKLVVCGVVSTGWCLFGCLWCTSSIELVGLVEVLVDVVNLEAFSWSVYAVL